MPLLKKYIPAAVKRFIRISQRSCLDLVTGINGKMARSYEEGNGYHPIKSIIQPIRNAAATSGKIHNLQLALRKLDHVRVGPGQIFSFWHLVKAPYERYGYQRSRTIRGEHLREEVGGGLCQLSGLVYFLALHAGLTITERHAHSIDIYSEEERFTPLGSDATVVYGYKDLRFQNPYDFPLQLSFTLTETSLSGIISAALPATPHQVEFNYERHPDYTNVITISTKNGQSIIVAKD